MGKCSIRGSWEGKYYGSPDYEGLLNIYLMDTGGLEEVRKRFETYTGEKLRVTKAEKILKELHRVGLIKLWKE